MKKNVQSFVTLSFILAMALTGCGKKEETEFKFTYSDGSFTPTLGSGTNSETFNYQAIKVNPIATLRDDFAMGVDASMVKKVEEMGGKYYNKNGVEQDVFQIMADNGVNFFRVRLWNQPRTILDEGFGGGDVDTLAAIAMSQRAKAAGMNVMIDYHYSDFWADPDNQKIPTAWAGKTIETVTNNVQTYTRDVLNQFKTAGVDVDAVQIGNEINNGMIYPHGKIDGNDLDSSFDVIANFLKAGIAGVNEVNPKIAKMIHLANGGSWDEFNVFFENLEERNVEYDLIGASYYPYYHGTLEALKNNLDNIANKFKKPVIVAEMSYGYTVEPVQFAAHTYNAGMEDAGKYITSIQGQATAIADVVKILSEVPNNLGLGIFYWEPAWLPVEGAGWATAEGQAWINNLPVSNYTDGLATWSNQALFSYQGRMLPSLQTFKLLKGSHASIDETILGVRTDTISLTLNKAANETMPTTYSVETDFDAIRQAPVVWNTADVAQLDNLGTYTVHGVVAGSYNVTATVTVTENFISDPGFEEQGETDQLIAPWVIEYSTPADASVVKLNRKPQDVRTGTSDLNWYHGSSKFTFKVSQSLTNMQAGTYQLKAYIMAIKPSEIAHSKLQIFIETQAGTFTFDYKFIVNGWGTPENFYIEGLIDNLVIAQGETIKIGIEGAGNAGAWGHLDDWSLIKI